MSRGAIYSNFPSKGALLLRSCPMPLHLLDDPDTFLEGVDRSLLDDRKIDVLLVIPPGFQEQLAREGQATLFLLGTVMDYEEGILKSGFTFKNPNQTGECGCGESVSITPAADA